MVYGRCPVCAKGFIYSVVNGHIQRTCAKPKCILEYERRFVSALKSFKKRLEEMSKEEVIEQHLNAARKYFPGPIIDGYFIGSTSRRKHAS